MTCCKKCGNIHYDDVCPECGRAADNKRFCQYCGKLHDISCSVCPNCDELIPRNRSSRGEDKCFELWRLVSGIISLPVALGLYMQARAFAVEMERIGYDGYQDAVLVYILVILMGIVTSVGGLHTIAVKGEGKDGAKVIIAINLFGIAIGTLCIFIFGYFGVIPYCLWLGVCWLVSVIDYHR